MKQHRLHANERGQTARFVKQENHGFIAQAIERVGTLPVQPPDGDQVGNFLPTIQLTIRLERCDRLFVAFILMAIKVTSPQLGFDTIKPFAEALQCGLEGLPALINFL